MSSQKPGHIDSATFENNEEVALLIVAVAPDGVG